MKYPNPINKTNIPTQKEFHKDNTKAHLGQDFETLINNSNDYYLKKDIAIIHKKPVPIQITKVSYPSRNKAKITEAFYQIPSTTDYNGVYQGYHLDFEAKSCATNSFTLKRLYAHQITHLINVDKHGGIAFLLIHFKLVGSVYVIPIDVLKKCFNESLQGGKKSISLAFVIEHGLKVNIGYTPPLDYLKVVDVLIQRRKVS